jgi:acetyl esterase/lipase
MASVKSRLINFMIRYRHLLQGKRSKPVFDMQTSIEGFREQCEKGASKYASIAKGVRIESQVIGGIQSEWHYPEGAPADKVILYVHGGGYVSGSCNDHRGFVSKFAQSTGFITLIYEYRLAPEFPFPAALDDSLFIYRKLLETGYLPTHILVTGESAGGGLCLALLLAIRDNDLQMPAAAIAISPWTDLTCSSESYRTKNSVSAAPLNSWTVLSRHYAGGQPYDLPLISPLFGNLTGLPPLFINSGEYDELYEDGEKFHLKALKAGVNSTFRKGTGMLHCYPLLAPMFPEASEAMKEIVVFVRKHLGQ